MCLRGAGSPVERFPVGDGITLNGTAADVDSEDPQEAESLKALQSCWLCPPRLQYGVKPNMKDLTLKLMVFVPEINLDFVRLNETRGALAPGRASVPDDRGENRLEHHLAAFRLYVSSHLPPR